MTGKPVNSWQEVIHAIVFKEHLLQPGRIAFRLHAHSDYLSDICRRERVDPMAVCNEILKEAAQYAETDIPRFMRICGPILNLLTDETGWIPVYLDAKLCKGITYNKLCEYTGVLCETLGGTIKSLARIEADNKYNEKDDIEIAQCQHKIGLLIQRLQVLSVELNRRRKFKEVR